MPNRHTVFLARSSGRTGIIAASILLVGAVLAGCTPVGVAVGAGAAGVTATQKEKGFSQSVDDTRIRAQLNADFIANNVDLFQKISFTVEEGQVLLTGNVPTPEARVEADRVRSVWWEGLQELEMCRRRCGRIRPVATHMVAGLGHLTDSGRGVANAFAATRAGRRQFAG